MSVNGNPNDPLRLRYFNGLIMKEEEFLLEQDYHIRMRRLLTRQLHDGGIVSGLDVEAHFATANTTSGYRLNNLVRRKTAILAVFDQQGTVAEIETVQVASYL